uniref:Phospholipid-transporting ATPase n=1 Tax=Strongyloides stercoralis TaxID=6248 RepID=A0A913I3D3_STRER
MDKNHSITSDNYKKQNQQTSQSLGTQNSNIGDPNYQQTPRQNQEHFSNESLEKNTLHDNLKQDNTTTINSDIKIKKNENNSNLNKSLKPNLEIGNNISSTNKSVSFFKKIKNFLKLLSNKRNVIKLDSMKIAKEKISWKGKSETQRILKANNKEFNKQFKYADNFIKTSKYTIITFVPKNLFEQFRRLANAYFLLLMCLQFIKWISSISWYSTAIPLVIVLAFSGIKDAYDDFQRHRTDRQVNNRIAMVVRNGHLVEEKWMNVKVGDIIRMENEDFIASDVLLLSSSEPHGLCYIETAELDGETNLKTRSALPETAIYGDILKDISSFDGKIICEPPNNRLSRFEGKLEFNGDTYPIDNNRMLLRGCRLRNTRWCYGVVVFAGKDTKLMQNSGVSEFKRTSIDKFLNFLIMGIVLFLLAMCLICTILCGVWEWTTGRNFQTYLSWDKEVIPNPEEKSGRQIALIAFLMFFSYIILLNTVVPISLYVSVEILRFVHSLWINFDRKMYDSKNDVPARARTTTLNEELGQVQYIFSDKTGTLTQNVMTFNKCSINGRSYGDVINERGETIIIDEYTEPLDFSKNRWYEKNFKFYDRTLLEDTENKLTMVDEFWRLLGICHTVMPERKPGNILEYQAQSPDEAALTSAARNFGYVFKSRTPQSVTLEINGKEEVYQVLQFLDFDNVRKRMSVIVKGPDGKLKLYCKGADTIILKRISPNTPRLLIEATSQHLDQFASSGLRTLCVAYKELSDDICYEWLGRLKIAASALENRDEKVGKLYDELEVNLTLIGATAIEDKLQEHVPETIEKLTAANIKIWVLTGDKTETAINIGFSCKLLTDQMKDIMVIDGTTSDEVEIQLKDTKRIIERGKTKGSSVSTYINNVIAALERLELEKEKTNLLSPRKIETSVKYDKSLYYSLNSKNASTNISISHNENINSNQDRNFSGENDEEDKEGFALVINGDSLTHALSPKLEKFFLDISCECQSVICCRVTPLQKAQVVDLVKRNKKVVTLAVGDGANDVSMIKTAHIGVGISGKEGMQAVLASDYSIGQFKFLQRLLLVHGRWSYFRMLHFWYSFFCGYSAMPLYDPVLISCYNLFFTALPCLAMGVLDQDVDDDYSIMFPKLYIPGQYNLFFNMRIFIYSVMHGIYGQDLNDYAMLSFTTFTGLMIVVTGQIMMDTSYWTPINHFCVWVSVGIYFGLVFIYYEALSPRVAIYAGSSPAYGITFRAMSTPHFWFSLLLISVILLLPVLIARFFWIDTHPSYADKIKVHKLLYKGKSMKSDTEHLTKQPKSRTIPRTVQTKLSRRRSLRSGYAFSHSAGFGDLILKGKLFKNIENLRLSSVKKNDTNKDDKEKKVSPLLNNLPEQSTGFTSGSGLLTPNFQQNNNITSTNIVNGNTITSGTHNIWINEDIDDRQYINNGYEEDESSNNISNEFGTPRITTEFSSNTNGMITSFDNNYVRNENSHNNLTPPHNSSGNVSSQSKNKHNKENNQVNKTSSKIDQKETLV